MDPNVVGISPTEIYELIALVAGVGVSSVAGYLVVRRARAARRRMIDEAGEPRSRLAEPARKRGQVELEPEPEPEPLPEELPEAEPARAAPAAPARLPPAAGPSRPEGSQAAAGEQTAQVIPFPTPALPTPPLPEVEPVVPPRKKRDATALVPGLSRTRSGWVSKLGEMFAGRKELDPAIVDDMEKVLLSADIGVRTSQKLIEEIRSSLSRKDLRDSTAIWDFLRRRSAQILTLESAPVDWASQRPFVLLIIGVNGSGKTTTIGKLAAKLAADGKKVMLAAGDTFRAAAVEQLEIWSKRTDGVSMVRGKEGADPSSVIFDAVKRAGAEGYDVVIADTAGRLHTKTDLMQELEKVRRVVAKAAPGAPHETWLVIDSTSGQNAIAQAEKFTKAMSVSGIVLTKLDGTAKGGVILGIADYLQIPVRYVGIGERVEDLREFDAEEFVEALYAPVEPSN
jgi:fused signal recognition particle receptor